MKKRILSCLMALALCLTLLPATAQAADNTHEHSTHPICGKTCSHTGKTAHPDNAFANAKWLASSAGVLSVQKDSSSSSGDWLAKDPTDNNCVLLTGGYYYLSTEVANYEDHSYVRSYKTIKIQGNVTICLNGTQIQKVVDNTGSVGPVFEVPAGSTLTLTDCKDNGTGTGTGTGKVTCEESSNGSGVYVNGGILNLYGGQITKSYGQKGTDSNKYGGGVYVSNNGTFTMNGGTITNNKADIGGGVYVNGGTFTMNGGTISNNTSSGGYGKLSFGGAGVYVEKSGNFIMNNTASVTGNTIGYGSTGGAGVYVNGGTFEMHNSASVKDNTANNSSGSSGGGVYVNGGTFKMHNNASVTGNTATNGTLNGAGVYVSGSGNDTFTMNDNASVTGNTAKGDKTGDNGHGGGVYVDSGTFNMNGSASVTNNNAAAQSYGGGVFVKNGGTFNMNGGAISENTANQGGGVYASGGTFNMNGNASIKSNTVNGVYVHNNATFTVSGSPTVTGNKNASDAASNVFLIGKAYITIGDFDSNGNANSIGVTKKEGVDNGVIAKNVSTDCSGKFFSDDQKREVKYEEKQLVLKNKETQSPTHEHKWTYRADKATITATCANTDGNCDVNKSSVIITVSTDDLTYNGKEKPAMVKESEHWKSVYSKPITITYEQKKGDAYTSMEGVPKNVGKYKASITVGGQTASVEYAITGKKQEPLNLASDNRTLAVGETLKLTVTGGSGSGEVSCHVTGGTGDAKIKGNVLTAEKVGTVMVTAVKKGDEEFAETRSGTLTLTITEKTGGGSTPSQPGGSTGGNTGGSSSGSSSSGSYDSNPIIKTETKNNADGSTTKTETRKDGTVTQTTTAKDGSTSKTETKKDGSSVTENKAADGSTGTIKTDKNGKTEVEIPVSNANAGTVAIIVRADGTEEIIKNSVPTEDGIRLTVDGSATVKIVDNAKGFIDTQTHWAKDEIDFVSARELVNGISATRYAPDATATRAQMWTILARQNDADLTGGANWYEKAQLWSKDKGISDGTNPGATITRAQMVTMLWRTMGQPAAGGAANFNDVPANSYYAQAVAWAVESGITTGVGNGRFDPNSTCTRAQIAAFLARSMK